MAEEWKHTVLLVIDMQKDLILPYSPAAVKGGEAIVPNVINAVEVARNRDIPIIWVVREHDSLGRDVESFRRHFYASDKTKLLVKGSPGAELVEGSWNLQDSRVQTPNCIRQTVFDAVSLDYDEVTVIVDATAAATAEIHNANVVDMKNIGVATPTLEEWCHTNN
ncbi:probable inactive nicotinamidase At3g16190 isoform X2 [Salvia hispanica]|uniref:probable inactive nicotinamidase At3g16190 isoform X2 n=1 Tax=Salvia hispanica TaxID=49212 RepID=UPI002008F5BA|nr:probable inactive nicotinamidase At3g16190 isoform X2 [Salvia hispanica]